MDDEEHGSVRPTDPITSHQAAWETHPEGLYREILDALHDRRDSGRWYNCFDMAEDKRGRGFTTIKYSSLTPRMDKLVERHFVECRIMFGYNDKYVMKRLNHYRIIGAGRNDPMNNFNLGEAIRQVRAIEAKMDRMEDVYEAKVKPFKDFAQGKRAEILSYLLATGQKSATTEHGRAEWRPKVTYRVEDKDEFRQYVIAHDAWELITWAAASVAAETYTKENDKPPPGTVRNSVVLAYITAPAKPRVVKGTKQKDDLDLPEDQTVAELNAMASE